MKNKSITLSGKNLTIEEVKFVARDYARVTINKETMSRCLRGREILQYFIDRKDKIYGVTTGFGSLSRYFIEPKQAAQLQVNLPRSHNSGVGDPVPDDVVRATMLIRANFLASGMSGARPIILETLIAMINKRITPVIPQLGSVGSSGDLAPLAAMACVLMGEGEAIFQNKRMPARQALKMAGISPIKIQAKEGLALINGDTLMVGYAALAIYDAQSIAKLSDICIGLTLEGINGVTEAFDERLQISRRFAGQISSATNVRKLIAKSSNLQRKKTKVQDSYVMRCSPVIMGSSRDTIAYVRKQVETEMNGSCDNPLVYFDPKSSIGGVILAGGNFHGQPVALPLDFLRIAVSEFANSAEIRMERLLNPNYSEGLPAFLIPNPGLNSGFMVPQYTAAGLVNQNKGLAWPNSVDSIPLCAGQEDHVSMGTNSALSLWQIVRNTQYVMGIELLIGCQALDLREQLSNTNASPVLRKVRDFIRTKVPFVRNDIILTPLLEQLRMWVQTDEILKIVSRNQVILE